MRLGHACSGITINLGGLKEAILTAILPNIFPNVQPRRTYDINIYGQSSGSIKMKHQGSTSFKDEGTAGPDKGLQ